MPGTWYLVYSKYERILSYDTLGIIVLSYTRCDSEYTITDCTRVVQTSYLKLELSLIHI